MKGTFVFQLIHTGTIGTMGTIGTIAALSAASSFALAQTTSTGSGQAYPAKPVRIVVPFPAGGPIDMTTRPLAQKLSEGLGGTVVVDNRGGANGNIGAENVAKSPPDGYSLVVGAGGGFAIGPHLYTKLSFDVFRDFAPVSLFVTLPQLLVVHPQLPVKTVKELVALAKAKPNQLNYGSSGTGGSLHLGAEMLKLASGIDMLHVPYKGAILAMADVIGGHIDVMFISVPPAIPQVKAGKLRALATASAKRARGLPDVPTFAELGYADFEVDARYGLVAPAGTPREIIAKLSAAVAKAAQTSDLKERYAGLGLEPISATPEQYAEHIRRDIEKWRKVVAAAKIKPQ